MTSTVKNNKLAKVDDEETFKCSIFTSKNSEFFTYEYDINDVAASARNQLTKGFIQDDIIQYSGAAVTTRGRYISKNDYKRNQQDRSLYLYIQGSTKQNIELAVKRISLIIQNESENPNRACGGHEDPHSSPNPTEQHQTKPATTATHVEKLYIGLDGVPASFNLRGKIIGVSGLNLEFIHSETGAAVTLRGQGSLFVEAALGTESTEPLHLFLEHPRPEGLAAARKLAENLVHTLVQELHQTDFQQQQQVINNPPPQMSMPPPPQQHLSAPPQYPTDHPWPSQNNQSNQMSGDQSVSQLQLQQVVMQPPPCPLTIPPPGVHIPEHQGPLVPPPQMVQLSAPPPPGPNPMIPPPPQPIYHSQDMVSSNSMVNYTHMPGNFYQRAPPQNQAPMGNNQNDNSIDPHSQPPPQIITQVQLDPNSQIMNSSNQIPHNFQPNNQPKFQVMGQFQNQNNQLSHMRQSHDNQNDNISHFNDEQHNHQDHLQQTDYNNGKPTLRHMNMYNPFIKQDVRNVQMNMPNPNQIQNQQNFSNNFMPSDNRMSYPILGQMPPNRPHMVSEAPPSNQMFNQFMNHQGNNQNSQMINPMNLNQDQHVNNQFQSMQMSQIPSDNNQQLMHQPGQLNILEMDVNQQNNPRRVKPTDASDSLKDESKKQANPTRRKYRIRKPRNNRSYVPPWSRNEPERPNRPNDRNVQTKEVWEFNKKVNAEPQRVGEERPSRFQPAEDEGRSQDDDNWQSTQYRMNAESGNSLQENNSRFNNSNPLASNNQGPPRNMFTSQYGQGDSKETQLNRNRNNPEQRKARSPEGGRKRKFEQENDWVNQSENQISDSAMSSHKKRNDQEEYQAGAAGSQCSGKSAGNNSSKTGEPTKSAKSSPSKCSDLKDEIKLEETDTTESPDDDNVSPKKIEVSNTKEKRTETGTAPSNKKPQSWPEQRIEYRSSPVQYTHNINQFQGQSAPMNNDNSMNHQYQQNYQPYMNTGQMFQGNMPYHLPPPPPPPGQGQNNSMQLQQPNMQFNGIQGNNAPPNMMMSNNNQCYGQNPQGHSMMNVSQNMLPNMNPHNQMQAMNCNVGQNMHHNTQYDMSQNMMNMGHQMMPNNNYMVPPNMPPGMNQMPSMNMGQNMSSNMGQMMPNQMQNMGQNMQHNMGQHLMPNMGQNPSSFMGQNAPNNMQHMGQNMMNQNMNSNMPQGGLMNNQNMGQGMPLMMNNSNQSMMNNNQMGMGMSMGQTGHVGSPMVAPPTNGPPPMIPCGLQHTAPPPPPPYPYFNN